MVYLWPGYWYYQLGNINELFCEQNKRQKKKGTKRVVRIFLKIVLEMYWVNYFGGYLQEERINDFGGSSQI